MRDSGGRGRSGSLFVSLKSTGHKTGDLGTPRTGSGLLRIPSIASTPAQLDFIHSTFQNHADEWKIHVTGYSKGHKALTRALQSTERGDDTAFRSDGLIVRCRYIALPFAEFHTFRETLSSAYHPSGHCREESALKFITVIDLSRIESTNRAAVLEWVTREGYLSQPKLSELAL